MVPHFAPFDSAGYCLEVAPSGVDEHVNTLGRLILSFQALLVMFNESGYSIMPRSETNR